MRKSFVVWFVVLLMITSVLAGCSGGEKKVVDEKPAVEEKPAAEVKPIILSFATHVSADSPAPKQSLIPWMDAIEEATGGRVKIERYWDETLCKAADNASAVSSGMADMAYILPGFTAGMFPINEVFSLPFLPVPSNEVLGAVAWQSMESIPEIRQELENLNMMVLSYINPGPYVPMSTQKAGPIKTLEDWKGKKLRAVAGPPSKMVENMGAVPTMVPMTDLYMSLDRGVVDGAPIVWETVTGWGFGEVMSHFTDQPTFFITGFIGFNLDTWNGLPADIQEAILSVTAEDGSRFLGYHYYDTARKEALDEIKKLQDEGNEKQVYEVSQEELDRWIEVGGNPTYEWWAEEMAKSGILSKERAIEIIDEIIMIAKKTPIILGK